MKVVATSDFHGYLPEEGVIPPCDLLLIAGDTLPVWDHSRQFQARWLRGAFRDWLLRQPAKIIVGIGGNHDHVLAESRIGYELPWIYLENDYAMVEGFKVWGSPLSPTFGNWSFMRDDRGLASVWETIPEETDILLVHGPAYGYLDEVNNNWSPDRHVGSLTLRNRIHYNQIPNLKLLVCGHIHEGYGLEVVDEHVEMNVSRVSHKYDPINPPMEIEL